MDQPESFQEHQITEYLLRDMRHYKRRIKELQQMETKRRLIMWLPMSDDLRLRVLEGLSGPNPRSKPDKQSVPPTDRKPPEMSVPRITGKP